MTQARLKGQALSALLTFVLDSAPAKELTRLLGQLIDREPPAQTRVRGRLEDRSGETDLHPKRSFGRFTDQAMLLMSAIIPPLVHLRDTNKLRLTLQEVERHLALDSAATLAARKDIPLSVREDLNAYLRRLPGMDDGQLTSGCFTDSVRDQYGYIQMQWLAPLRGVIDDLGQSGKRESPAMPVRPPHFTVH